MYDKILNPLTNRHVSIYGKVGKQILKNYLIQLGGSQCRGRRKGPKGKTCYEKGGKGCCEDVGIKDKCKWVKRVGCIDRVSQPEPEQPNIPEPEQPNIPESKSIPFSEPESPSDSQSQYSPEILRMARKFKSTLSPEYKHDYKKKWMREMQSIFDPITTNLDSSGLSLQTLTELYNQLNSVNINSAPYCNRDLGSPRKDFGENSWAAIMYPYICALTDNIHLGRLRFRQFDYDEPNRLTLTFNDILSIPLPVNPTQWWASEKLNIFSHQIFNIVELIDRRFFIFKVGKYFVNGGGHANVIIIDKHQKTIEYFEPWGGSEEAWNQKIHSESFESAVKKVFSYFLSEERTNKYKFISAKRFLPYMGIQLTLDFRGLCDLFTFYYVTLRLSNPNIHRSIISSYMINGRKALYCASKDMNAITDRDTQFLLSREQFKNLKIGCKYYLILDASIVTKSLMAAGVETRRIVAQGTRLYIDVLKNIDDNLKYIEILVTNIEKSNSSYKTFNSITIEYKDKTNVKRQLQITNTTFLHHFLLDRNLDLKIRLKKLMLFINLFIYKNNPEYFNNTVINRIYRGFDDSEYVGISLEDLPSLSIIKNDYVKIIRLKKSLPIIVKSRWNWDNEYTKTYNRYNIDIIQPKNDVISYLDTLRLQNWFPDTDKNIYSKLVIETVDTVLSCTERSYLTDLKVGTFYINKERLIELLNQHTDLDNILYVYEAFNQLFESETFKLYRSEKILQSVYDETEIEHHIHTEMMYGQWGYYDSLTDRIFANEAQRVFKPPTSAQNDELDLVETFSRTQIFNPPVGKSNETYDNFCKLILDKLECDSVDKCTFDNSDNKCKRSSQGQVDHDRNILINTASQANNLEEFLNALNLSHWHTKLESKGIHTINHLNLKIKSLTTLGDQLRWYKGLTGYGTGRRKVLDLINDALHKYNQVNNSKRSSPEKLVNDTKIER